MKKFYDYKNQAWVVDGKYIRCGHPDSMDCNCYGKLHEGEDYKEYQIMKELKIYPDMKLESINHDCPTLLECLADDLAELGEMSKGNFNNPPWDNQNVNTAANCLQGMIENIRFIARINGLSHLV